MPKKYWNIPNLNLGAVSPGTAAMSGILPYLRPTPKREDKTMSAALSMMMRQRTMESQEQRFMMGIEQQQERQLRGLQQQQLLKMYAEKQDRLNDSTKMLTDYTAFNSRQMKLTDLLIRALNPQTHGEFVGFLGALPNITDWDKMVTEGSLTGLNLEEFELIKNINPNDISLIRDMYKHRMIERSQGDPFEVPDTTEINKEMNDLYLGYTTEPTPAKAGIAIQKGMKWLTKPLVRGK